MKRRKTIRLQRVEENYIFYTCLILVLAVAAIGLAMDAIR